MTPTIQAYINSFPDKRVGSLMTQIFNRALLPNGVDTAITATAGGVQATALSIKPTVAFHEVTTVATAADAIKLPPAKPGEMHFIKNSGANSMQVFGAGTDTIDSVATATGVAQEAGDAVIYVCLVAGNYIRLGGVATTEIFGAITVNSIAGGDASLGITGQAAAQGGAVALVGGTSSTSGNAGGAITAVGGTPGATGVGGAWSATSGAGGTTSGASGAATLATGTTAAESASASGNVIVQSGAGSNSTGATASGASGTVTVRSQASGTVATGTAANAGAVALTGGNGGAASGNGTGGNGAAVAVTAGTGGAAAGTGAAVGGVGGAASTTAGNGGNAAGTSAAGAGGAASVVSGSGGAKTGTGTADGGAAGTLSITGGAGGATASTSPGTGGAGATVAIAAGNGGAASAGTANGGAAGSVTITAGTGGTSAGGTAGLNGGIHLRGRTFMKMPAPQTATDTASLTDAQMIGGVLVATPTAAAAYTVRTGTELKAALPASLAADDSFDLIIINIGGTGDDITLTAATDITIVGDPVVRPSADSGTEQAGQGTFRFRYTTGVTFIAYRIS